MYIKEKNNREKLLPDTPEEPHQRPRLISRIVALAFVCLIGTNLLYRVPHCYHAISNLSAPPEPLTIDQRAKNVLTHTPLIGKETHFKLSPNWC